MLNKNLALIVLVVFAAGCGVEARTYVMTKDRENIDQTKGNRGCIVGNCPPVTIRPTRKVYVLELTKPVPESEVQKIEETAVNAITDTTTTTPASADTSVQSAPAAADTTTPPVSPQVVVPVVGELPGSSASATPSSAEPAESASQNAGSVQVTTYTVQKDDTLQKISKKVYGTYKRWYKIYKANKDKIANPNVLKAGTVLTIPALK